MNVRGSLCALPVVWSCMSTFPVTASTLPVPSSSYPTIQSAIDAAQAGDEVVVSPATYNEAIDFLGKAITLRSSDGSTVTTIDGTGFGSSVVKCINGEGPDTVLDGFTITGGTGTWSFSFIRGGGLYVLRANPTVRNCVFIGNSAETGGGIHVAVGSINVSDCTFIAIHASFTDGAGMSFELSDGTVRDCLFERNTAGGGAAISFFDSSPAIVGCTFLENEATDGGAVCNERGGHPVFQD